ncbi:MAG: ABC transporter permease [Nitriliruptoraceae bacterium]
MTAYLVDMVEWFGVDGRWSFLDGNGVPFRVIQHVWLTLLAMVLAVVIALPPALKLAHDRRAEALASGLVNLGRAIPSFGLIVVFFVLAARVDWIGTRHPPLVVALVALALPPIFTNAYTAIREVDAGIVEASRGMGYTERQLLREVEVPLASPVIMAGLRIAFLQVIATVAIGAIVTNTGGVGYFIVRGFAQGATGRAEVLAGALLLAALTLLADLVFTRVERRLIPHGVVDNAGLAAVASRAGAAG